MTGWVAASPHREPERRMLTGIYGARRSWSPAGPHAPGTPQSMATFRPVPNSFFYLFNFFFLFFRTFLYFSFPVHHFASPSCCWCCCWVTAAIVNDLLFHLFFFFILFIFLLLLFFHVTLIDFTIISIMSPKQI